MFLFIMLSCFTVNKDYQKLSYAELSRLSACVETAGSLLMNGYIPSVDRMLTNFRTLLLTTRLLPF